jgi:pyruvate kinase
MDDYMTLINALADQYGRNPEHAKKIAEQELSLDKGDKIIITGGDTSGTSGNTSLIKIENI